MGTILIVLQFGDVEEKCSSEAEITGLSPNTMRLNWKTPPPPQNEHICLIVLDILQRIVLFLLFITGSCIEFVFKLIAVSWLTTFLHTV